MISCQYGRCDPNLYEIMCCIMTDGKSLPAFFSHCNPYIKMLISQSMFPVGNAYNTWLCHSHWDNEVLSFKDNSWQRCLAPAEQRKSTLLCKMTADTFTHCWLVFMQCLDWGSQRVKSWHISFHSIFSPLFQMLPVQSKQWNGELTAVVNWREQQVSISEWRRGVFTELSSLHLASPQPRLGRQLQVCLLGLTAWILAISCHCLTSHRYGTGKQTLAHRASCLLCISLLSALYKPTPCFCEWDWPLRRPAWHGACHWSLLGFHCAKAIQMPVMPAGHARCVRMLV